VNIDELRAAVEAAEKAVNDADYYYMQAFNKRGGDYRSAAHKQRITRANLKAARDALATAEAS